MDTIHVELRDQTDPTIVVGSANAIMDVSGYATFNFSGSLIGGDYNVAIFHRNAVQTWTATPMHFTGLNDSLISLQILQSVRK